MTNKIPTQDEIERARTVACHTQAQAAALVYASDRTWRSWVSKEKNHRQMPLAAFELYLIKTNQEKIRDLFFGQKK